MTHAVRPAAWEGTTLLLCGASHMGKSFVAKQVLVPRYGAIRRAADLMYAKAVVQAGMCAAEAAVQSSEAKRARRHARDGRWPDAAARAAFFASYEAQIAELMRLTARQRTLTVIEGGTLRRAEEVGLVLRHARAHHGEAARIVRFTVELGYEDWLRNRVNRALLAGAEALPLSALSRAAYEREAEAARPGSGDAVGIEERRVSCVDDVHRILQELRGGEAATRRAAA